jgi:hypothetical protein
MKAHRVAIHGIGDANAFERRRKVAAYKKLYNTRQPFQRCDVEGCGFHTNRKSTLKEHGERVHSFGGVAVTEARRKRAREYQALRPARRCDFPGCECTFTQSHNLKKHQATMHGIGSVEGLEQRRKYHRELLSRQSAVTLQSRRPRERAGENPR